jgi:hypothetical protein
MIHQILSGHSLWDYPIGITLYFVLLLVKAMFRHRGD